MTTNLPVHPGQVLLDEVMSPLGVSRAQLARDIDVPIDRIRALIMGKAGINADMALRLGRHFGTSAELWMKLQADYDLETARAGAWQQLEPRIRVFDAAAQHHHPDPVEDEPSGVAEPPGPQQEPLPSLSAEEPPPLAPESVEIAANENLSHAVEDPPPELDEPAAIAEPTAEEPRELASGDDVPALEDEEPLELTELVEEGAPGDIAIPNHPGSGASDRTTGRNS